MLPKHRFFLYQNRLMQVCFVIPHQNISLDLKKKYNVHNVKSINELWKVTMQNLHCKSHNLFTLIFMLKFAINLQSLNLS